jgi:Raf kinase inhibitor-like YbhB/YbcL family protein
MAMPLTLKSPAFSTGGNISRKYTCDGPNISPPFEWSGVPANAQSLLLVCDDTDAPGGTFQHWAAFNIPAGWTGLKEGYGPETLEKGFRQAINDFNKPGYAGPCPPRGHKAHAYHFRLAALSTVIDAAGPGATCDEIKRLAAPYEIEFVELIGFYGR